MPRTHMQLNETFAYTIMTMVIVYKSYYVVTGYLQIVSGKMSFVTPYRYLVFCIQYKSLLLLNN